MKRISAWLLAKLGWKTLPLPAERPESSIICVAPHTSNIDFFLGKLYYWSVGSRSGFLMKKDWFFFPFGSILRAMGGVPVDRSRKEDTVGKLADYLRQQRDLHIAITPEGTRKLREKWYSGFYHIAVAAGVPIELAVIDYKRRALGIFEVFHPTGDSEADIAYIRSRYLREQAKYPDQFYEFKA
ncbi:MULTISPECIES: 1-acyl-sn-glycerol-3-phosphate acyltransferase [unclassified Porphyromonas]|uniref:1-acyl-sn-glycerol-3-phosphate acyltransferase n=1 Tax=unclassified Porphyromonas TaxID=2645799 RepID=UPI00052DB8C7|nr:MULTISPECIES: 1-acyl-sn-glycerol-3-phosphate acyltransferase [unclassified Porphyromonas]KGN86624.1 acyltransferase [Porphyromonas sp. COT-290 OH860]KGN97312.1 acyltransferase [Porphyromonas sp. COT-290 OH3588]